MSNKRLIYFVRTPTLAFEARVERFFQYMHSQDFQCEVFGVVNRRDAFSFKSYEYVCISDRIKWKFLKVICKLIEIQVVGLIAYVRRYREADTIVVANHEYLIVGLILRFVFRAKVVVDLHEHYYAGFFKKRQFSRCFFTRLFSGVVFANSKRAEDFLGLDFHSTRVAIARNFPLAVAGDVSTPAYSIGESFKVAIVGAASPGRYVFESIQALDCEEFSSCIEIHTFGPKTEMDTSNVSLFEHGVFNHKDGEKSLLDMDASLVFYDPDLNGNFRLCEPNRFFQAYNMGKIIFCFEHQSLEEFYDAECRVIKKEHFSEDIREALSRAITQKSKTLANLDGPTLTRKKLRYASGLQNVDKVFR